jgi:hypothetical protein
LEAPPADHFREKAKRGRQLDVVKDEGAQYIEARGGSEIFPGSEIQIDIGAQLVDDTILMACDPAESVPGRILEKDVIVEAIIIPDGTRVLGRIRIFGCSHWLMQYFVDLHG